MNFLTTFPIAVNNFIFDRERGFLFFSPDGAGNWRVMGGQLEAEETIPECIAREVREELGSIDYRLLDILDAHVYQYRDQGPIVSVFSLLEYLGGDIRPMSDMEGYTYAWRGIRELKTMDIACPHQFELVEKAHHCAERFVASADLSFLKFRWKTLS